jgi:predicted DNA-binding transcriptional regulator AlpA
MESTSHPTDLDDEILMDTRAAASYLTMSEAALSQMRVRHTGPAYLKIGPKSVRYAKSDLDAFVTRHQP